MSIKILISFEVRDFSEMKTVFDAAADARAEAGIAAEAYPESTEGGRRVSVLKRQEGAPVNLG